MFRSRRFIWILSVLLVLGGGIGFYFLVLYKGTAEISGAVMIEDAPLPAGMIYFCSKSDQRFAHSTISDGKYNLKTNLVGDDVIVFIDTSIIEEWVKQMKNELEHKETRLELIKKAGQRDAELSEQIKEWEERLQVLQDAQRRVKDIKISSKFTSKESSPLSYKLKRGQQTINIELTE